MPRVSPDQFKNYSFEAGTDAEGVTHVVAFRANRDNTDMYPIGSMKIDGSKRREALDNQEKIYQGEKEHGIAADFSGREIPGQLKWTGGTMDDATDRVSWLGLDSDTTPHRDVPHVLRAMLGIGVDTHGSIPHADYDLSEYGSRIAKAMHRRYGIKPHPENPDMHTTFSWASHDVDASTMNDSVRWYADSAVSEMSGAENFKSYDDPDEIAAAAQRLVDVSSKRRKKPTGKPNGIQDPLPGME